MYNMVTIMRLQLSIRKKSIRRQYIDAVIYVEGNYVRYWISEPSTEYGVSDWSRVIKPCINFFNGMVRN